MDEDLFSNTIDDSETQNDEDSEITKIIAPNDIKENVIKYVSIDNLIKEKENEIKELKSQKKPKEIIILNYLDQQNQDEMQLSSGGKIEKNKTETKGSMNIQIIKQAIDEIVKNPEMSQLIIKRIEELRPKTSKVAIKVSGTRRKINRDTN